MSSDEERGSPKLATTNEKTIVEQHQPSVQLYNNVEVVEDNGILSKLRRLESKMDAKLGVEAEAINRKLKRYMGYFLTTYHKSLV